MASRRGSVATRVECASAGAAGTSAATISASANAVQHAPHGRADTCLSPLLGYTAAAGVGSRATARALAEGARGRSALAVPSGQDRRPPQLGVEPRPDERRQGAER